MVSNQPGIARGYFAESILAFIEDRLRDPLRGSGIPLAGFYYCPHDRMGRVRSYTVSCTCRKPRPGLLQRAAREHGLDLRRCWWIGDILDDIEAGHAAGCQSVLVGNGNETKWVLSAPRVPDYMAQDLDDAARFIMDASGPGKPLRPRQYVRR